jgi:hypothetical protein
VAAGVVAGCAARSALPGPAFAGRLRTAVRTVEQGDLEAAGHLLGGLGPGLTPSGDDALAGILLAARFRWGSGAQEPLMRIAAAVRTHDIARAFLLWAARGQSIRPLHRCVTALASGDRVAAAAAVGALAAYGHHSGADLGLGLLLGLVSLPSSGELPAGRGPR